MPSASKGCAICGSYEHVQHPDTSGDVQGVPLYLYHQQTPSGNRFSMWYTNPHHETRTTPEPHVAHSLSDEAQAARRKVAIDAILTQRNGHGDPVEHVRAVNAADAVARAWGLAS